MKFTYYAIRSLTITRSFILCASYRKIFQRLPDPYYVIPASSAYSLLYGETKGLNTLSFVSHFHVHEWLPATFYREFPQRRLWLGSADSNENTSLAYGVIPPYANHLLISCTSSETALLNNDAYVRSMNRSLFQWFARRNYFVSILFPSNVFQQLRTRNSTIGWVAIFYTHRTRSVVFAFAKIEILLTLNTTIYLYTSNIVTSLVIGFRLSLASRKDQMNASIILSVMDFDSDGGGWNKYGSYK